MKSDRPIRARRGISIEEAFERTMKRYPKTMEYLRQSELNEQRKPATSGLGGD